MRISDWSSDVCSSDLALANISKLKLSTQPSDGEMILAATEYHRSGTGGKGRGRGFADMKRFVDICTDGELRVLSNRGSYHYLSGAEAHGNAETSLGGTLLEWRFQIGREACRGMVGQ